MLNKLYLTILVTLASALAGCSKSADDSAREKERLRLEQEAQRDVQKANKAITEMTDRAFKKKTPEEEEKAKAEKAKRVQELIDAQKKADAEAAAQNKK